MSILVCPNCQAQLALALVRLEVGELPGPSSVASERPGAVVQVRTYEFTLGGRPYSLTSQDLLDSAPHARSTIVTYYIEIRGTDGVVRQYPTKSVVQTAIVRKYPDVLPARDLQPNAFQAHRAVAIARALGFPSKRRG